MKRLLLVFALLAFESAGGVARAQELPLPDATGACPSGTHRVDAHGTLLSVDADGLDWSEDDPTAYRCASNQTMADATCSAHGTATVAGGVASCACEQGYGGAACEVCAFGYAAGGTTASTCTAIPVNRDVLLLGAERVVPFGGSTTLSAEWITPRPGADPHVSGAWRLDGDPALVGCIAPVAQPAACAGYVEGSAVLYAAPAAGTALVSNKIHFVPTAGLALDLDVRAGPPGGVPVNGWADSATVGLMNGFLDFVKARCAGAGSLGLSKNGKVVLALGYGMQYGRNAEAIYNPACSDDVSDPYQPTAGEMQYDTPFMFGSVSKATSYATARWALKRALRVQDVDVRLVNLAPTRAISAQRIASGELSLDVWSFDALGNPTRIGGQVPAGLRAKDFALVRMTDARFILVARTEQNTYNVYAWSTAANGTLSLTDSVIGGTLVKQVDVTSIVSQRVVVGVRRNDDTLLLRTFKLEANGSLTTLGSETGGPARNLRIVSLPGTSRVVGAARLTYPDIMKFIVWNIDASGQLTRIHETQLGDAYRETGRYDLTALSAGKLAFASQSHAGDPVHLDTLAVDAGSGAMSVAGAAQTNALRDFRIKALDATHYALVGSRSNNGGDVQQFVVNAQNVATKVGASVVGAAGNYAAFDLANASAAGWGTGFAVASRDAGDTLTVATWDVGVSSLTKLHLVPAAQKVADYAWTDADVEALMLVRFDFPNGLLPNRLYDIVGGHVEPPMHVNGKNSDGVNTYTCVATQAPGYPAADARWKNIALRNFLAHSAGLSGATISEESLYVNYLDAVRGLTTVQDWYAQEQQVIADRGAQNVINARVAAGLNPVVDVNAPDGFLVPRIDLEDLLVGSSSMCLPVPQNTYVYSNTDPLWLRMVAEHVSGQSYTAPVGDPLAVDGTLLNDFIQSELGISSNGLNAIAARAAAPDANGNDLYLGPVARLWDASVTVPNYYATYWDTKRPFCTWKNGTCTFANPSKGPSLDWNGHLAPTSIALVSNGESAATGSLAVQIVPHLKFMSKFWSSGYDGGGDPIIGERRSGGGPGVAHNGAAKGAYGWAIQYAATPSCPGLAGVDLIVAVNQANDKECPNGSASCPGSDMRYNQLRGKLDALVCAIDWSTVTPNPVLE